MLSGTWKAKVPPAASAAIQSRNRSRCRGPTAAPRSTRSGRTSPWASRSPRPRGRSSGVRRRPRARVRLCPGEHLGRVVVPGDVRGASGRRGGRSRCRGRSRGSAMRAGCRGGRGPGREVDERAGAVAGVAQVLGGFEVGVVMSATFPHVYLDVKRLDIKRLHVDTTTTLIVMEDEVDRLVAAWRRERPDLDVEPLEGTQPGEQARPAPGPRPTGRRSPSTAWSPGSSTC